MKIQSVFSLMILPGMLLAESRFDPPVVEATLYRNRASILCQTSIALEPGKHTLVHDAAYPSLLPESLRATTDSKDFVIQGISSFSEAQEQQQNEKLKDLEARIKKAEQEQLETDYAIGRLETDLSGVDQYYKLLATALSRQVSTDGRARTDARNILMERKLKQTRALSEAREKRHKQHESLEILRKELQENQARLNKQKRTVQITIYARKKIQARVGYYALVPDAGWNVSYSIAFGEAKIARLKYFAEVVQKTGRDWNNVKIFLSTAEPALAAERPALPAIAAVVQKVEEQQKIEMQQTQAEVELEPEEVAESNQDIRMQFALKPASLKSGNQKHMFLLGEFLPELKTTTLRIAGPAPASLIFRLSHTGNVLLLPGSVDIFKKSGFSGRSRIERTPPGASFEIGAATDTRLKQERSVAHRRESSLSGKNIFHTIIRNAVQNRSQEMLQLEVQERMPLSEVSEIQVELKEAEYWKPRTENSGIRIRKYTLAPGQKMEYTFHYTVQAPASYPHPIFGN